MNEITATITKGTVGTGTSVVAVLVARLDQVNGVLQTVSLLVGIAVGLATFWSIVRKPRKP